MGRPAPFATSYMVGLDNKTANNIAMLTTLKSYVVKVYQGPVKIELLKLRCRSTVKVASDDVRVQESKSVLFVVSIPSICLSSGP